MVWVIGVGIGFVLLYLCWIEPRWLVIRRYREPLPGLKTPLKVVVASDLQPNSLHWPVGRLGRAFAAMNRENPDLAVWLGDFVGGKTNPATVIGRLVASLQPGIDEVAGAMMQLKPKMGHVAVLGERDRAASEDVVTEVLERHGVVLAGGDIVMMTEPESLEQLQVLGYGSRLEKIRGPGFLHERINRYVPVIGICHSPDEFVPERNGPPVILGGHTHGGQVRLPWLGAFVLPVENRRFDRGWFTEWGQRFFVTSGMGTAVLPVRFLCPPEIVVIEFIPAR